MVSWGVVFIVTKTVSCCNLGDFCRFCGMCVLFCGRGNLSCTGTVGSAFLSVIRRLCLCRRRGGLCAFCARRLAAFHDSHFPGGSARLVIRRWLGAVGRFAKLWLFVVVGDLHTCLYIYVGVYTFMSLYAFHMCGLCVRARVCVS